MGAYLSVLKSFKSDDENYDNNLNNDAINKDMNTALNIKVAKIKSTSAALRAQMQNCAAAVLQECAAMRMDDLHNSGNCF